MTAADLEISRSVELEVFTGGKKTTLLTTIEKVINQTVLLTPIRIDGKLLGFPPSCLVNLIYPGEDCVYFWPGITVKAVKHAQKVYHCTTLVADAAVMNRRGSYRVYIGQEMLLTTFTADGSQHLKVFVKDISESGFAFFGTEQFDVGRTVRLNLFVKKDTEIRLSAKIVRTQEETKRPETLYGCKFIERNPFLSRYLMRQQQEHQKQKMGF